MKSNLIVGLDIGTTKICAIVGRKNEHGKLEILGDGKAESFGVSRGVVQNIERTIASIITAVEECSKVSNIEIRDVYVGIAGQHIKSCQHRGQLIRRNTEKEISKSDVDGIIQDMHKLAMQPGEEIIHVIPQEFIVDGEEGVREPVGMPGTRLEVNCHIITGLTTAAKNINKCVTRANLNPVDLILEPLASSEAVLIPEEKEAGVVLVDIGGGTTDVAIFKDGVIRHTAVIPFGGNIITEDIKMGCNIIKTQAELLKVKFGSAMSSLTKDTEIVSIPGLLGRESREISIRNLSSIIQARMEEIIYMVDREIFHSGLKDKISQGIVITGGGAQLKHIQQLFELVTGMSIRIGYPNQHLAKGFDHLKNPMFATSVGLVLMGLKEIEDAIIDNKIKVEPQPEKQVQEEQMPEPKPAYNRGPWYREFFKKSKELLTDETDEDLK